MAVPTAPLLPVLGLDSRAHNLQLPQPWCPSHQDPVLRQVFLVLLWDTLAHVVSGAQGTSKPLKMKQMGNQQAGVSAQSRKNKVKTKVFPEHIV